MNPLMSKHVLRSRRGWGILVGFLLSILGYLVAFSQTDAPWSWREFIGVASAAAMTALCALGGSLRGGPPLRFRSAPKRPGRSRPTIASVLFGAALVGLLAGGCGTAGLDRVGAIGPVAVAGMQALKCSDLEVKISSDFARPQDLVGLEDVLEVLAELQATGSATRERDVIRILLKCPSPGPWLEVFLEMGVAAGVSTQPDT